VVVRERRPPRELGGGVRRLAGQSYEKRCVRGRIGDQDPPGVGGDDPRRRGAARIRAGSLDLVRSAPRRVARDRVQPPHEILPDRPRVEATEQDDPLPAYPTVRGVETVEDVVSRSRRGSIPAARRSSERGLLRTLRGFL